VGIQYVEEKVDGVVPASYPGKLLAVLLERYRCFNGDTAKGFTIVPTELLVDNGRLLKEIVLKLAAHNELPADFINWINTANTFCSSLVDRIVPGKPKDLAAQNEAAGYEDGLWIEAEPFLLWAIEGSEKVAEKLSFKQADERMLVAESITPYREQKLRILNGSHTAAVAVGYLSGLNTVYECMQNPVMKRFFETVVLEEILPTLQELGPQTEVFAKDVLDRFANPFIEHKLLSITFQQSAKTNARNVRTLLRYYEQKKMLPPMISMGVAASILFIKPVRQDGGKYQGQRGDVFYDINDDNAAIFAAHWDGVKISEKAAVSGLVQQVLGDKRLWETDLNAVPGFSESITDHLYGMLQEGVNAYVSNFSKVH
jgi:tagaturonate reductase